MFDVIWMLGLNNPFNQLGVTAMDNQHQKITGYRDLKQEEIDAMNKCTRSAVNVGILCDEIAQMGGIDQRWVAIAKTDLQKGFMALIRAIARPETF